MILSVTNTAKLLNTFELSKYQAFKKCKQISITHKKPRKTLCINGMAKICFITYFCCQSLLLLCEFLLVILVGNP